MSKFSQLIESISSKEMVEADKLFESILAEKISEGLTARENLIQEEVMAANPDLFQSPVDQAAALAHAPVEAEHSERTDEIDVPEPVEVDGHRDADPSEEEQEAMNEEYGMEQIVLESHDFEADEDEQHQHPENVAKVPVGASAETNQGTVDMEPSQASPEQIEEDAMCEECGLTECECVHEDSNSEDLQEMFGGRGYNFQFDTSVRRDFEDAMLESGEVTYKFMDNNRNAHKVIFAADETEANEVYNVYLHSSSEDVDHKDMMATILNTMEAFIEEHDAMSEYDGPEMELRGLHVTLPEKGYGRLTGLLRRFAGANGFRMGGARKHRRVVDNAEVMTIFLNRASRLREELSPKQKKIDLNKNGKIDGEDLAKLRKEEEGTDEPGKPKGDELEEGKGPDKAPRSRRSPYTVGDKIARTAGNLAGAAGAATAAGKAADAMNAGLPARAGMVAGAGAAGAVLAGTAARQLNRRMRGAKE